MPDDIVPTASGKTMKSGYGVKTEVRATLSTDAPTSHITYELLAEQDKTLQEIYFPETLIEEEAADAKNSDVESEPQETETAESAQSTNETAPSAE